MTSNRLALGAAKVGAVALALAALSYLVLSAQRRAEAEHAQPAGPAAAQVAPDPAPAAAAQAPTAQLAPTFLPSSKSMPLGPVATEVQDPVFLMGSKSGLVTTVEPGTGAEPVFLPSSKVLAIDSEELFAPEARPASAPEVPEPQRP